MSFILDYTIQPTVLKAQTTRVKRYKGQCYCPHLGVSKGKIKDIVLNQRFKSRVTCSMSYMPWEIYSAQRLVRVFSVINSLPKKSTHGQEKKPQTKHIPHCCQSRGLLGCSIPPQNNCCCVQICLGLSLFGYTGGEGPCGSRLQFPPNDKVNCCSYQLGVFHIRCSEVKTIMLVQASVPSGLMWFQQVEPPLVQKETGFIHSLRHIPSTCQNKYAPEKEYRHQVSVTHQSHQRNSPLN